MGKSITFDISLRARDNFADVTSRLKKAESEIKKTVLGLPVFELKCKPQIMEVSQSGKEFVAVQSKKNQDSRENYKKSIKERLARLGGYDGNESAEYIENGKSYDAAGWVKKMLSEINVFKSALKALGVEAENKQKGLKEQLRELKKAAYGVTAEQNEDGTVYDRLTGRTYSDIEEWEKSDYKVGDSGILREIVEVSKEIKAVDKGIKDALADMAEPVELGACESVEELEGAIGILEARAKRSGAEGAIAAARLKVGYERALGVLRERIEIPGLAAEAARIEGLTGHEHKVAIRSIGVEKIREEIRNLQRLLSNAEISIGGEERAELEQLIATYRKWAQECSTSCGTVSDCLGGLGEMLGNIAGMTSKSAAAWLQWGAKVLDACSKALPAILAVTCAKAAESAAETPLVGWIMAGAAIAGVIAAFAGIPKFANGGIAYGPTVGVFGEYAGASSNPEVVAPLDRLRSLLGDAGGGGVGGGRVEFEISGRALRGVLRRVDEFERRTR